MTSTASGRGDLRAADGGRLRPALKGRLGAAGRLVGSLTRTTVHARRPEEPERRRLDGVVEVVVQAGETVADVASRSGASTAGVLALNELGWHTPVQEGQVLLVRPANRPAPAPVSDDLHRHRVGEGETVSTIAGRHGVATAAVLLANGLSRGSAVRAGQQLVIPVPNARRTGSGAVRLSGEMRDNAARIVEAGRRAGMPDDGLVVALAAAMEDSSLHSLEFGEADAVGVFQQRPSDGWGSEAALLDPYRAALAFFGAPEAHLVPPATGLLGVDGWPFLSVGEAAAAVQGGTPAAYAKWERSAREWLRELDRRP